MVSRRATVLTALAGMLFLSGAAAQQPGSLRGNVYDKDFEVPLAAAQVVIAETNERVLTTDQGNYVFPQVAPGTYTIVFAKEGYAQQVMPNIMITAGQLTELDATLANEFTEMEEFLVQDVQIGSGTETALLEFRMEAPALIDSIGADMMSQAGASDAASALNLVSGTTVQDGKYAVIRGLPDRYVNSQINGIRLPTADQDKRAVELDQFPAAAIESIQVSKTFTPDQQGDASGGAVNVVTKAIPDEWTFKISGGTSYNRQHTDKEDFLSYGDSRESYWGMEDKGIPRNGVFDGPVGVSRKEAPTDYKWSLSAGGKHEFEDLGFTVGGLASLFYERDSSFYDNGIDDKYWVETPGQGLAPQAVQGAPEQGDFKTSLFDITQGSEEVKWGGLGALGVETENHSLNVMYMYTRVAEDVATLAEDTRGKEYYFPGYDPDDPTHPGNLQRDAAPYIRTETLEYTERETKTLQFSGRHKLPDPEFLRNEYFTPLGPEIDWSISRSSAKMNQPDKRQFGSLWWGPSFNPGFPPFLPPGTDPAVHRPFKPAANFTVGNLQRIWKEIEEESDQYAVNVKFPFEQWSGDEGYFKFGIFDDQVVRTYNQDSFSNFNDNAAHYFGPFDDFWSRRFPDEVHPITAAEIDVDYIGEQHIAAWYYMADIPLISKVPFIHEFRVIGGLRHENTDLSIVNTPEKDVTWIPPGAGGQVTLNPGDADVSFRQGDVLPSIGFVYSPFEKTTLRGTYSETVARQTFKELTPIQQQEFLGGDVFIGNPFLQMSSLKNYDLRFDYTPFPDGLLSVSYFKKDIENPIEYVQRIVDFAYTTPINYPEGELSGYEFEVRQGMGHLWDRLEGLSLGANYTMIDAVVTLPKEESIQFDEPNIMTPIKKRDMTNAPEYLYNLYLTYELDKLGLRGTQFAVFYTVRGDTLIAGAGQSKGKFVPDVYEKEFGTLNMSLSQKIGEAWKVQLQAKNLLDPKIETVYRSKYIGKDVTKTSSQKGMEFSIGLSAEF